MSNTRYNNNSKPQGLMISLKSLAHMLDTTRTSIRRRLKDAGINPNAIGRGPNWFNPLPMGHSQSLAGVIGTGGLNIVRRDR